MEAHLEFEKPILLLDRKLVELRELSASENVDFKNEIHALELKLKVLIEDIFSKLTPWQRVQLSRHPSRPYALDYIQNCFEQFVEFQGDRLFGDDPAIIAGFGRIGEHSVAVIAQQKGRNTKQKIERNFGMARPEGYRKALRIMKLAEQFGIPIVTLIDTPGAYPGIGAEERGQSEAIAKSIMEMFDIETPIISCVIGEGGSGGALAIGIADKVLMQQYSTYSVISPESCASILWSDSSMNEKAAQIMKMNPEDLHVLGVIDGIIPEPVGGAHRDWNTTFKIFKDNITKEVEELLALSVESISASRKEKFRNIDLKFLNLTKKTATKKIKKGAQS